VRGIHKEDLALACGGLRRAGLELTGKELQLKLRIDFGGQWRGFLERESHLLEHVAALALAEEHTAQRLNARDTFLGLGHWRDAKRALQALPELQQGAGGPVVMIREHFGQTALEIGHERGRTQPQAIDDEAMRLPFVMHAQGKELLLMPLGYVRIIQRFANVLNLLGAQMQFDHAPALLHTERCK